MARLIGIENIGQLGTPQYQINEPNNAGIVDANYNRSIQVAQGVREAQGRQNELLREIQNNTARTQETLRLRESVRTQARQDNLTGFAQLAQTGLQVYAQLEEQKARRREEERQRQLAALQQTTEQLLVEAPTIIRGEGGYTAYQQRIAEVLRQYEPYADPETLIQLTQTLYNPAQEIMSEQASARFGTFSEIFSRTRETSIAQNMILFSSRFSQIQNAASPEEAQQLVNSTITEINSQLVNMRPIDQATVSARLLTELSERYDTNTANFGALNAALTNWQEYTTQAQSLLTQYNTDGDILAYQAGIQALQTRYDIQGTTPYDDPLAPLRDYENRMSLNRQIEDGRRQAVISAGEQVDLSRAQIISFAYSLYSQPEQLAQYEAVFGNNPDFLEAQALAETLRTYNTTAQTVSAENATLAIQAQNIRSRTSEDFLSWFGRQEATLNLESLGILSQLNSGLRETISQYVNPEIRAQASPEQIQQWQNEIVQSQNEILQIIQNRINSNTQSLDSVRMRLRGYDIDSEEGLQRAATSANQQINLAIQRVQEARQQAVDATGQLPNFNAPQLETTLVGEAEAVLPVRPVPGNLTAVDGGIFGAARPGRRHAGYDLPVGIGTDVVMYVPGTVVRVGEDIDENGNGYGHYVDVRSPDGYLHRFAHLSRVNVSEGDRINAGDVVAVSGDSGSGGAHIHWEVRPPGAREFGFDGAINPLDYTSQLQSRQVQARNGNNSEASRYGLALNQNEVIRNNQIINLSTGAIRPVQANRSNPLPRNYASTRRDDYTNDPSQNYGYQALANDRPFRIELHRVAQRLNVPAQWLADVMAYESRGFQANAQNSRTRATGLIQFMPDTLRNLSRQMGQEINIQQLARMSRTEQLRYVEAYLRPFAQRGELTSPYAVLLSIFSTPQNVRRFNENPVSVRRVSDGDITFEEYTRRLGSTAGRQYEPLYQSTSNTNHRTPRQNCTVCQGFTRSATNFVPHVGARQ